jgi:hypothetical protein
MITLRIKENSKQAKMFAEYAKSLPYVEIIQTAGLGKPTTKKEVVLTAKDEAFLKKVRRSAKQVREIVAGTRKGNPIENLMNDL